MTSAFNFFDDFFAADTEEKRNSTSTSLEKVEAVPKCPKSPWNQSASWGVRC